MSIHKRTLKPRGAAQVARGGREWKRHLAACLSGADGQRLEARFHFRRMGRAGAQIPPVGKKSVSFPKSQTRDKLAVKKNPFVNSAPFCGHTSLGQWADGIDMPDDERGFFP
ncbi:hypothetical protein QPK87_14990 [Kamptonema cortianum]|nr:hypothetical protein [Kamptonema cortianum]